MTHLSKATVKLVDNEDCIEGTEFVSHFGFPIDLQFLAKPQNFENRPYLLLQVNSVDSWGRHRIEGYSFARLPQTAGYHKVEVETWRPRGSLNSEIHSFFLGGSIRMPQLEELVRTHYVDEQGKCDIVNRFGLETENSGRVTLNLNLCYQNAVDKKRARQEYSLMREATYNETKKQVNAYKLKIQKTIEHDQKVKMQEQHLHGVHGDQLEREEEFKRYDDDDQARLYNQQQMVGIMNTGMGAVNRFQ